MDAPPFGGSTKPRPLGVVLYLDRRKPEKVRYAVLFSTDTALEALELVRLYRLRFQIEIV